MQVRILPLLPPFPKLVKVNVATLHLMVGLPCSGKTTYARQLARETNALVLTPDVWHLSLFGDDVGHAEHDARHQSIETIMWDIAKHVLALGGDVILDFGCWARVERDDFRQRAKALGADFKLHYLDVPYAELYRRLELRNRTPAEGVFVIPKIEMDKYIPLFQPPTEDELV
jgi:predicted kinase